MVNPSKTCASFDEIEFLEHTVNSKGVRISDSKTQAIRKITTPSTRRSLQRLLGLLQYFRKHVSNYSLTYNTRQLLKQDSKFQWTEQCENELQDLKNALINAPILAPFQADRKVYIYTNGSLYGLGACCLQMNNLNQPEICSYMSIALTDAEKKWHSFQLEMFAIATALRQHETFLLQSEIDIFSDNAVCVSLEKYRPMNVRENRLLAYISQFRIKMRYIQGKLNRVADALSRLPADIKSSEIHAYEPPENLKNEEFIVTATEPIEDLGADKLTTDSEEETNIWTAYRIQYESTENKQKNPQELNPNATIFVPLNLTEQKITAPITPLNNEEQQNPQNIIAPTRRSDRIAARRAKELQQQAVQ